MILNLLEKERNIQKLLNGEVFFGKYSNSIISVKIEEKVKMDKKVIEVFGVVIRMLLRYWAKDSKVLSSNIVDAEQFAQQCGLSIWDARRFNRSMESFIEVIAEDFVLEFGSNIKEQKRKEAILDQINKDIMDSCIDEKKLILEMCNLEELQKLIMAQSENERKSWSDTEIGLYTNCIKYICKASTEFVSKLPSFTTESLKVVVQRQEEYHKELRDILQDIHSMTSLLKRVDVTYREYESTYREKLVEKYSKVELIGSGLKDRNIRRYDLSSAYVELNCINDDCEEEIELSKVFNYGNVTWIKGEAGSGKTTFLQWVSVCAAKGEYNKIDNIRNTIPIVIGLRNIEWPINLHDIASKITSPFGSVCPEGWILELLKEKRMLLLFDGLDEISQMRREETYNFIEEII